MIRAAAIFPGQLSERVGMGRRLAETSAGAARVLDRAEGLLGADFRRVLFEGPRELLATPRYAQSGVIVVGLMAHAALAEAGLVVEATAGYSLGVFAALAAAGSFGPEEAVAAVLRQREIYERRFAGFDGAMGAVLGVERSRLEQLLADACRPDEPVNLASHNGPRQFVVTGARPAVARALELVRPEALKTRLLDITWPVHSPLLAPVAEDLARELPRVMAIRPPSRRVYSPLDGEPVTTAADALRVLAEEIARPVRWDLVMARKRQDGFGCFYECGPADQLGTLVRLFHRQAEVRWVGEGINPRGWPRAPSSSSRPRESSRTPRTRSCPGR